MQDFPLPVTVPCTTTLSPARRQRLRHRDDPRCLTPGLVDEGSRAVWQLDAIEVLDGGSDGDVDTPGNDVFATPGVFVP